MTVVSSVKDADVLRLTLVAEFNATPERVWDVWEDPRKLERWWGPPMYPATFTRHDFTVGGESRYYMTGPDGHMPHGWWREAPWRSLADLSSTADWPGTMASRCPTSSRCPVPSPSSQLTEEPG